jgi:hypothetical protein
MNPAVLDAFALAPSRVVIHTPPRVHEPDLAAGRKAAVAITASADELRAIAPRAGTHVSEGNFFDNVLGRRRFGARTIRDSRK